ncbi:ANK [Mytilus coruscus]|uniref:ANK n=1 Tax=Mytilus coruscus TaxID=42192 RepID=A0A6J8BTC9_MYTCO|nr:ANK [Mytilus coruscus]
MEHEADVNFQMNNGMTSIYIACQKTLLTYKADINKCGENGWSPLLVASNFNHYNEIVEYLCETPLHIACENDNADLVKLLLKHGDSINSGDENGFTSFHKACSEGISNIVELLIKENAVINLPDRSGRTPLSIACQSRCKDVVEILLKHRAEVNKAAQVDSKEGWTPLHVLSASGSTDITEILLQNNAIVYGEDQNRHTPLHYPTLNNHADTIELLVRHGAVINNYEVQISSTSTGPRRRKYCVIQ